MDKSVGDMWERYRIEKGIEGDDYDSWYFGNSEIADRLGELVVRGIKRATAGLKLLYDESKGEERFPEVGDISVITDCRGRALCIIKLAKVELCKFCDVTEEFAYIEGEGDKSLKYWKDSHREFFTDELKEYGVEFDEEMEVVLEYFEVVYR